MYINEKQQNVLKSILTKKIKIICSEILKDDPAANKKYIMRVSRMILFSQLKGVFGFVKWSEIKKQDYFKIIEYIEDYVFQHVNKKWYGWTTLFDHEVSNTCEYNIHKYEESMVI